MTTIGILTATDRSIGITKKTSPLETHCKKMEGLLAAPLVG